MQIINLTPHALHIRSAHGTEIVVEPSGIVPRLATRRELLQSVRCDDGAEVLVTQAAFGALTDMPAATDGVIYVVSALCAQSPELQGRTDVYAPGEAIRDAAGKIIAAQGLSYIAPMNGGR